MRVEFKERARNFMYCRQIPKDVQQARNKCEGCCGGAEGDVFQKCKRCLGLTGFVFKSQLKAPGLVLKKTNPELVAGF